MTRRRLPVVALVAAALADADAWTWRMASSGPFDRGLSAVDTGCEDSPPSPSSPPPPSPPSPLPPAPAQRSASNPPSNPSDSQLSLRPRPPPPPPPPASLKTDKPGSSRPRREHGRCQASYTWIEEKRWPGGLRARLDIGGDGVIEGWLLRINGFSGPVKVRLSRSKRRRPFTLALSPNAQNRGTCTRMHAHACTHTALGPRSRPPMLAHAIPSAGVRL